MEKRATLVPPYDTTLLRIGNGIRGSDGRWWRTIGRQSLHGRVPAVQPLLPLLRWCIQLKPNASYGHGLRWKNQLTASTTTLALQLSAVYLDLEHHSMEEAIPEQLLWSHVLTGRLNVGGAVHALVPELMTQRHVVRLHENTCRQQEPEGVEPGAVIGHLPGAAILMEQARTDHASRGLVVEVTPICRFFCPVPPQHLDQSSMLQPLGQQKHAATNPNWSRSWHCALARPRCLTPGGNVPRLATRRCAEGLGQGLWQPTSPNQWSVPISAVGGWNSTGRPSSLEKFSSVTIRCDESLIRNLDEKIVCVSFDMLQQVIHNNTAVQFLAILAGKGERKRQLARAQTHVLGRADAHGNRLRSASHGAKEAVRK
mmetsp:Transcript_5025/g.13895  ORF Transcript_5025/g.13895 Transcript_5025/m.13895 type:complete len:370 (+) Transcript_5025:131-1240(+)